MSVLPSPVAVVGRHARVATESPFVHSVCREICARLQYPPPGRRRSIDRDVRLSSSITVASTVLRASSRNFPTSFAMGGTILNKEPCLGETPTRVMNVVGPDPIQWTEEILRLLTWLTEQ